VFNASRDYCFVNTLDDHSSSITAVRFLHAPPASNAATQMVSCGADKSIIFREVTVSSAPETKGRVEVSRGNHVVGKTTLYDMEVYKAIHIHIRQNS
jgi:hypothetical protein